MCDSPVSGCHVAECGSVSAQTKAFGRQPPAHDRVLGDVFVVVVVEELVLERGRIDRQREGGEEHADTDQTTGGPLCSSCRPRGLARQHRRERRARPFMGGGEPDRLAQVLDGLVGPVLRRKHGAEVVVRFRVARIDAQRLAIVRDRLRALPCWARTFARLLCASA